jgi:indole-3-glycerol phosphate synthase
MAHRRFSDAISEGDGISVIVPVRDAAAAREAERQRAEALVVEHAGADLRDATALPILWRGPVPEDASQAGADAVVIVFETLEDEEGRLEETHAHIRDLGLDCVVDVRNDEELQGALERIDPDIFLLSPRDPEDDESPLEAVLALLADVPAGKLAVADLPGTTSHDAVELERAGVDAVIVTAADLAGLGGVHVPHV